MNDQIEFDDDYVDDSFPMEDVLACRSHARFQQKHSKEAALKLYLEKASACQVCHTSPAALEWFYFESPPGNLKELVLVDLDCEQDMNEQLSKLLCPTCGKYSLSTGLAMMWD